MPNTWKEKSKKYIGYIAPPTRINQEYVTTLWVQELIKKGYSKYKIGLIYNGGQPIPKKGSYYNKEGKLVKYDSGAYADKLVAYTDNK